MWIYTTKISDMALMVLGCFTGTKSMLYFWGNRGGINLDLQPLSIYISILSMSLLLSLTPLT